MDGKTNIVQAIGKITKIETTGNTTIINAIGNTNIVKVKGYLDYGMIERGTNDHNQLINRDLPDQHPISAITDLSDAIHEIQVSISRPTNPYVMLWFELELDINEFMAEIEDGELIVGYPDDDSINFELIDGELVISHNIEGLDFNLINGELEVEYAD